MREVGSAVKLTGVTDCMQNFAPPEWKRVHAAAAWLRRHSRLCVGLQRRLERLVDGLDACLADLVSVDGLGDYAQ